MRFLSVVIMSLGFWGCSRQSAEEPAPKPVVAVKLARAEATDLKITVRAPATVFPREQATVSARITAPIQALKVRKGDTVSAGQVLAVLESRDVAAQQAEARGAVEDAEANLQKTTSGTLPTDIERARGQVATTEAALNQAQKIYERRNELFKQGAIPGRELLASETELAQAKTNHDVAKRSLDLLQNQSRDKDIRIGESRVQQAKARLGLVDAQRQFTELRSPFAGTVTDQFQYPGDMAKPDSPLFTIMDLSIVMARAQVPESASGGIRSGQSCSFEPSDAASVNVAGRVTMINKAVDPARRTVEVWCEIANGNGRLRGGVFGNLTIVTGNSANAVVVPLSAVQFTEGTQKGVVFTVDQKHLAHKKDVDTGEVAEGKVQIRQGVSAGESVIVEGGYGLPDGTEVKSLEASK